MKKLDSISKTLYDFRIYRRVPRLHTRQKNSENPTVASTKTPRRMVHGVLARGFCLLGSHGFKPFREQLVRALVVLSREAGRDQKTDVHCFQVFMAPSICFLHLSAICYLYLMLKKKTRRTAPCMHLNRFESTISRDAGTLSQVVCL